MSTNHAKNGANSRGPSFDTGSAARRVVVIIAAGAGIFGILAERPVLSVAWRAAAVAVLGVGAIHLVERVTGRFRSTTRDTRGGLR